ncbi:hypothetical protein E8E13_002823 [Curvularia kusanoi]|uniref:DUF7136 domain-containing protein n=1 Tax=Curvularia kusanoi TaxID=90978 RepID=A0A9P4W839_CURKU|nr:hypothetical protein E8E13_002823 [Curvularia kusanoi]
MRLASQSIWALVGSSGYLSTIANAAGIVDIGLVFPRNDTTYSPDDNFPIVFAAQNSKLLEHLKPLIDYRVLNITGPTEDTEVLIDSHREFNLTSASEHDPYLFWQRVDLQGEGKFRVIWKPYWSSCGEYNQQIYLARNRTENNFLVDFEVRAGGQKVDLVAATNTGNITDCPNKGAAINVTDSTLKALATKLSAPHETCAVLGSSSPTPTSNPCKVKIDKATVESMAAENLRQDCVGFWAPSHCPKEETGLANPRFAIAGVSTLAAVFGAALLLA